ncbi:hypothetical protein BDA99DRAFT_500925 [Phascolomyces articulosus]|uniref:N-acetyltransferase domain-containing protein n=1 Tax=Phascolomyces articulosus TaxID=60185 RepID=A0AAD5PGU4_9FUNG|nr:hypothetical protein BDA99DRAFT_500925 [Phascolomyces articulosus]
MASTSSTSQTNPNIPPPATDANGSKIELRPYYGEKDLQYVHYLVYSTAFDLVPRGVRYILSSPFVLSAWVLVFASLFVLIPKQLASFGWPQELMLAARIAIVVASMGGGLLFFYWFVDHFVVATQVYRALANDLKDPGAYYRTDQGNFWLLTVQNQPVGCIGMDMHKNTVMEQAPEDPNLAGSSAIRQAQWPKTAAFLASVDDTLRGIVMGKKEKKDQQGRVLFKAHKPNEASIRRLAVKSNLQDHGLSTPLLKRVAFWAHSHQVEYLYAETNQLETKLADILSKRHGYELVSTTKAGWTGYKKVWRLDVKFWMDKEVAEREKQKELEQEAKEMDELKDYFKK